MDHFTSEKELLPLSRVPKPKSSFIPSKWEHKKIVKMVHAIRMGRMKPHPHVTPKPVFYQLWGEGGAKGRGHQVHIPAPRVKLPGHAESYNPPPEYIPTTQEVKVLKSCLCNSARVCVQICIHACVYLRVCVCVPESELAFSILGWPAFNMAGHPKCKNRIAHISAKTLSDRC